jgi:hypothetical protein
MSTRRKTLENTIELEFIRLKPRGNQCFSKTLSTIPVYRPSLFVLFSDVTELIKPMRLTITSYNFHTERL